MGLIIEVYLLLLRQPNCIIEDLGISLLRLLPNVRVASNAYFQLRGGLTLITKRSI